MVTSTKLPDKKVVKMAEQNNIVVVPQRTLLGEVNEHITCPLCRGYYIDATTIVECLHSFCRSCIIKHLQVKSYCPVCEMMINSAKPNIKLDKALQDIVYKLVPGLFQKEMERRQTFYASRPGPAATATPEQRGEDTERIIFSPEDVISFSLEYADATDADSISSKSSDSNDPQPQTAGARRFLQCPAVVNISHLKKFLSMKFDIDSTQFAIDILYKRVPLPDYYTLMDIAYIYNWKRNEPMRFFYQIIDYVAIRNRLFDINRKGTHFRDRKPSPASTEDTNVSSPAPNVNDQGSEASSGTDSPMPEDGGSKPVTDSLKISANSAHQSKAGVVKDSNVSSSPAKKKDEEVEKSQFLNSFELTAKNSTTPKTSPSKNDDESRSGANAAPKIQISVPKVEETLKRKHDTLPGLPEMKRLKVELEKAKLPESVANSSIHTATTNLNKTQKIEDSFGKLKDNDPALKVPLTSPPLNKTSTPTGPIKDTKQSTPLLKQSLTDSANTKRPISHLQNTSSPNRKINEASATMPQPLPTAHKTVTPLKLQVPKLEAPSTAARPIDAPKPSVKKIPDLKPGIPLPQSAQNKSQPINKVRMDLLANNSDPTMDRTKILSQVKSSMSMQAPVQTSGDPLKSLFNSCNINIPSSLSITLTDQKQDQRNPNESTNDPKKNVVNKNLASANSANTHKVPSPPVHNYIEILKLPDTDPKKQIKPDGATENRSNTPNKMENSGPQPKPPTKGTETSAKGPIPNLKPIADTKLSKQGATTGTSTTGTFVGPITFQQTFEQQLQSLQTDKKPKILKSKAQVPKLVPANPKTFNAATKLNNPLNRPNSSSAPPTLENKPTTALDLSTPPANIQSQLTAHQTKAFETMQSIANLAKKQNQSSKGPPTTMSQSFASAPTRPLPAAAPLHLPAMSNPAQKKQDKVQTNASNNSSLINTLRQEIASKPSPAKPTNTLSTAMSSPGYQLASLNSPSPAQPSPRSQTRSPSSSPKLVIAEEKQTSHPEPNLNQSNQISSTQASSINNAPKSESPKASPGPSKPGLKPSKPVPPANKITVPIRQPITPTVKPNPNPSPADYQYISAHHAFLRHMEMNAWLKAQRFMSNMAQQAHNEYNKDKQ